MFHCKRGLTMNYLKNIKNIFQLKKVFRKLSKKYHPDNKETGDVNKFIELKNEFDILKNKIISKPQKLIFNITAEQAYNGCDVKVDNYTFRIPPKIYNRNNILVSDNENIFSITINIKPTNDEEITYSRYGDLIITKYISIKLLDLFFENTITLKIFNSKHKIKLQPEEILKHLNSPLTIKGIGYPLKANKNKKGIIKLKFRLQLNSIDKSDKKLLKEMRNKYK